MTITYISRTFLLSLLVFVLSVHVVFADVSGFVFTTDSQTILPSTLSGPITIQSQNGLGVQEPTTETTDLTFTSTSATGQFVSSSGKAVSKTMAKGTANRTFYYSDSTLGTYTITITATGRTSKKSFSTTQQIIVASTLPQKPAPIVKTPVKTTTTVSVKTSTSKPTKINSTSQSTESVEQPSSTNVATVYEGAKETSMFDSLFDWPGRFWYWCTHIFS